MSCLHLRETDSPFVRKTRNNHQPEGRQAKSDTLRTDYEGPAALQKFSGNWVCL